MIRRILSFFNSMVRVFGVQVVSTGSLAMSARIERQLRESNRRLMGRVQKNKVLSSYIRSRRGLHGTVFDSCECDVFLGSDDFLVSWASSEAEQDRSPLGEFMKVYISNIDKINSQWAQDAFVLYVTGGTRGGRFLEIGAADGMSNSNTLSLEMEFGWTGTLVEPGPGAFNALRLNRGRHNCFVNAAAGPDNCERFVSFLSAGELSCVSGREGADQHTQLRLAEGSEIKVVQLPFSQVMLDAGPLDYLSLDVEGAELDLLRWIDWGRTVPPRVITVEHNWRVEVKDEIKSFLSSRGYASFFEDCDWLVGGDLWFVHGGTTLPVS